MHAIVLRIDPFTGLTAKLSYSGLKLSAWAERYELEHYGTLQVPSRAVRRAERATFQAAVDEEMVNFQPTPGATPAQARKQRGRARKQTRKP